MLLNGTVVGVVRDEPELDDCTGPARDLGEQVVCEQPIPVFA